jgi:hypothetical protein
MLEDNMGTREYLIGFFYADGCLHKQTKRHKNSLSVTLSKKDSCVINEFRKIFGGITYEVKSGKYYRWYISDEKLYNEFKSLNLEPRKTFKLRMPKLDSYKDFIRGYFDGDGSVYFSQHDTILSEIWGTEKFLEEASCILGDKIDPIMHVSVSTGKEKTYRLRFNQTRSVLLYNWMYYPNSFCLERKRIRFEDGIRRLGQLNRTRALWTKHDDNIIIKHYGEKDIEFFQDKLLLPRTKSAIVQRASKLKAGINKSTP